METKPLAKEPDISRFLSDIERTKIELFNQDTILVNAIRKVLLAVMYSNGTLKKDIEPDPTRNGALSLAIMAVNGNDISNEKLGEDLRGMAQGVSLLELGLTQLGKITSKKEDKPEKTGNPAI